MKLTRLSLGDVGEGICALVVVWFRDDDSGG